MVRMLTFRLPSQFSNFSHLLSFLIPCTAAKILGIAFYGYWVVMQNRKRKKLVEDLGISEEDSDAFNIIAESKGMTDIDNIHFRYGY